MMRTISLFLALLVAQIAVGQSVEIDPVSFSKHLISSDINGIEVQYNVPSYTKSQVKEGDQLYDYIHIRGIGKMREPGKPALPAMTELIALPIYAGFSVSAWSDGYTDHSGVMVYPALQPAYDTYGAPDPEFEMDSALYQTNAFFPQNIVEVADTIMIRGIRVLVLRICPVQFNPVSGVIRVHSGIRVNAFFSGAARTFEPAGTENTRHFTAYLSGLLLNGSLLPEGIQGLQPGLPPDYIILTIDPFLAAADSVARWRQQMGYRTRIISRPSWTTQQVKDSVHSHYHNSLPRPDYLLIIGDHNHVPAEMFPSGSTSYPTDLYYVCMDGSADFYPDMAKGRISVTGTADAMSVVQKIINYERNPLVDSAFYTQSLHCAQFQDDDTSGYATRRFTHTSEEVRDYILGKGYDVQRIYYTYSYVTPTNYNNGYYSNGEPLPPALLKSSGFPWNGNETQIAQAINNGRFYVLHRDHGYVGGSGWAHPYFTKTSMNMLSNGTKLPVVFSINCHTGEFSLTECFAERFLRLPAGGAAGVFAASFASYSGYNDALSVGMFDGIWNNPGLLPLFGSGGIANPTTTSHPPILAMGDVMNHGLLRMVQTWNGSTNSNIYQYRLFHYFGDPAMRMFTANPQQITAQIPDTIMVGSTQLTVNGCNVQDALATVVYQNALVASSGVLNGNAFLGFLPLNDTMARAIVTISRHNCRPYIREVVVAGYVPAPHNDPCAAIAVPVNRFCDPVAASFAGADTSSVANPSCVLQVGRDIWYSFQVPPSGMVEVELGDAAGVAGLATYSSVCANPLQMFCSTTGNSSGRIVIPMTNLTPGDTILVRVWEIAPGTQNHFYLCIREADTFPVAQIPYYTGFENGIDAYWQLISSNTNGRIRLDTVCDVRYGNASLLMDQVTAGTYARNEAWLRLNLRDQSNVKLSFWWREYGDENNPEDGVFFSDDGGENFTLVTELKGSFEAWTQYLLDVDKLAGLHGLSLSEAFVVKFQQYDNWYMICANQTGGDGFAFDDIHVFVDSSVAPQAAIPYYTGFEDGFDQYWKLSSTHLLGRIVATGAYEPFAGGYHLMMDVSTASNYNLNTADLRLNLAVLTSPVLSFRAKSIGNENHPENGIWLSDDGGSSFLKVAPIVDTNAYWADRFINLGAVAQSYNLNAAQNFIVRFAQYDNSPVTSDGIGVDEVRVQQVFSPLVDLYPLALSWSVDTGQTGTKTFHLINPGGAPLFVDSISCPFAFSVAVALPATILPGDSLPVPLSFSPDTIRVFTGQVRIYHNGIAGTDSLRVYGQGMHRQLVPDIPELRFDTIMIHTSDTIEFQLTNTGNGTVAMNSISVPSGFMLMTPSSQNFSPGQARAVKVMFLPNAPGNYSGTLTVNTNANQLILPVYAWAYDPTGVEEPDQKRPFVIYPNPFRNEIVVNTNDDSTSEMHLMDMAGRRLLSRIITGSQTIDLRSLAAGVYLIEFTGEDQQIIQRSTLIKE
jgi:hypothetical protein